MGQLLWVTCKDCGFAFKMKDGAGFNFTVVRCDRCGRSKSIGFDARPVNAEEYRNAQNKAELEAGECRCGGTLKLDASPRCPKCRSGQIEEGETIMDYD
jgi:predicted nucleic-acid-binding Zn-ribbon protein